MLVEANVLIWFLCFVFRMAPLTCFKSWRTWRCLWRPYRCSHGWETAQFGASNFLTLRAPIKHILGAHTCLSKLKRYSSTWRKKKDFYFLEMYFLFELFTGSCIQIKRCIFASKWHNRCTTSDPVEKLSVPGCVVVKDALMTRLWNILAQSSMQIYIKNE